MNRDELIALVGAIAAVVVGAGIAAAGSTGSVEVAGWPVFALCGLFAFVVNWIVFVPSFLAHTEHYFDLTGSITYVSTVLLALALTGGADLRALLMTVMIIVWAVRLGSFLFVRVRRSGADGRFDKIKMSFIRFLMAWTLQGLWVFLTTACALAAITSAGAQPFGVFAAVGALLWVSGFAIEVIADRQKSAFNADPANDGRFINVGLWAWCRHPNYFGEILLWTGIAVMAIPVLSGWQYVTMISPLFVFVLLTRISGIPLLDARGRRKWGDDPDYQAYRAATPQLIPRPPKAAA